jgi:hypothetical protein
MDWKGEWGMGNGELGMGRQLSFFALKKTSALVRNSFSLAIAILIPVRYI